MVGGPAEQANWTHQQSPGSIQSLAAQIVTARARKNVSCLLLRSNFVRVTSAGSRRGGVMACFVVCRKSIYNYSPYDQGLEFGQHYLKCGGLLASTIIVISGGNYISSRNAFLFSLKNHHNQSFKSDIYRHRGNAIYGNTSYGPTFGGGHDLYLSNQCHLNTNSFTNVGHTYRPPLGYNYTSTHARSVLAGSYHFRCHEYEVFYLDAGGETLIDRWIDR